MQQMVLPTAATAYGLLSVRPALPAQGCHGGTGPHPSEHFIYTPALDPSEAVSTTPISQMRKLDPTS